MWYVLPEGENVAPRFEIQSDQIGLEWAMEIGGMLAGMPETFVKATEEMLVGDLAK